ncbi:MAG: methyltransferase domain-containing protein [Nitratireductor sp.]|nr:methyltransferase domain-containing protein [Nitratireductor sp.]
MTEHARPAGTIATRTAGTALQAGPGGHGCLMDTVYRRQRHIYDLSRKYYLLGRDRLIAGLEVPPGGKVLEIACGTGRNLIRIARAYPDARLYGFDISPEMLATARHSVRRAGLSSRIALAEGNAEAFDPQTLFGTTTFERVIFSYSLSMIPDWPSALRAGLAATAPGGSVHIADFGRQDGMPAIFGRLLRLWLARFHVEPRTGLEAVLTDLAGNATMEFESLYRDYARLAVIRTD